MAIGTAQEVAVSIRTNRQLRDVAFTFRNLFKSGHLSAAEILREAGTAHPEHRAVMHAGAKKILEKGWSFPAAVSGLFPKNVMPAVNAGSESGNLSQVFDQIWQAAKAQEEINGVIRQLTMPLAILVVGIIIGLAFYLGLVPFVYKSLATSAPPGYEPGMIVDSAVAISDWFASNSLLALVGAAGLVTGCAFFLLDQSNRLKVSAAFVRLLTRFDGVGSAYANLRFGLMARYLEIVSMAGLDIERCLRLVVDTVPDPLRPAFTLFQKDVVLKGMKEAARSEGRPEGDPRASTVMWPPYLRLAFTQADDTGNLDEAMREYGSTMIFDGKERLQHYIVSLNRFTLVLVGVVILVPMGTMYTVLGEIMTMRLQNM